MGYNIMQIESTPSRMGMHAIPDHRRGRRALPHRREHRPLLAPLRKGPRGIKVGKRVLYPEAELLRYERALIDGRDEWGLAS